MIKSASARLEALTDRKFVTQTWDIYFDDFAYEKQNDWWDGVRDLPVSVLHSARRDLVFPYGPCQSVGSVLTFDDADTEFEFAAVNYYVDTTGPFGSVTLRIGCVWPATILRAKNGIKIEEAVFGYGHGYTPAVDGGAAEILSQVPEDIQQAIRALVGTMYEHRGDELPKIPAECAMLIEPYRRLKVGV